MSSSTLNRYNKISLSLVDELWVNKDKLSVYKTFQLDLALEEISNRKSLSQDCRIVCLSLKILLRMNRL